MKFGENQNKFCVHKRFTENLAVCEIIWKKIVETERPHMTM
jgi:hypothetical protein